ncbi:acyl-CoA dehydrogenase family protein [Sphingopyxis sp. JAI108]|uniref:acyl-CoA dehydrogenase family protein n=1 Tax=Sphingopyxis sp. JAI108 TaxID=2723060 RepID=UPI0015C8F11D|nr:acyl-CoA dehydrogenase family protein [Sphingopyxis sp. JAI108]NYF33960.1 alkylation response protein AidB-like acyl-CoA dehydrogenase [Sphingopyxis sp. JAI108]
MSEFLEPFERMLENVSTPAAVRAIERGGSPDAMWQAFAESGFLDALVPEERGGAGLALADIQPLWMALGRHAVPLPVGETMIARALLDGAPDGPVALAVAAPGQSVVVPFGLVAAYMLIESDCALHMVEASGALTGVVASLAARMTCNDLPSPHSTAPTSGLRPIAAILRAALIAGASGRVTEMTAAYANERVQFGKPIGRQQALQQQMAIMAEEMVAARIASQLGCAGGFPPSLVAAATAKAIASRAAARVAATAHAVHGAIGISEEHDLQLFTRRLHEWRLADGSESYWNGLLGRERLVSDARSVDFVRAHLQPEAATG